MRIQVKKLHPDAALPSAGSEHAAGYDLRACLDAPVTIPPHETVRVGTGLAIAVPEGWFGAVFARSGLATKQGLRPSNCVGVCDSDYRGEYIVPLYNDSDLPRTVAPGDRIAQLVILPHMTAQFEAADELPETARGVGGFGSTGR
jgi:dUTP pyrophosphatase